MPLPLGGRRSDDRGGPGSHGCVSLSVLHAPASPPNGPSEERRGDGTADGTEPLPQLAAAVSELTQRHDRDHDSGRFLPGNLAAARGKDMRRSAALWDALAPAKRELLDRLRADLAVDTDAPATLDALLDAFTEVTLLRRSLFIRMSELGGPTTTKGKTRAMFSSWLAVLDREQRLAVTLGLERRHKPIDPLDAVQRAVQRAADGAKATPIERDQQRRD